MHDLNSLPVNFDVTDIRRCLGGSFDKGLSYQREGAVRDLRADKGGQRLIASVHGTRSRPYHVFVEIEDSEPVSLTARCTCPVGWNCKHAAAALIEALRKPPPVQQVEQDPLSGAVGGWLHQLRAAAHPPASPEAIVYCFDLPAKPSSSFALDMRVVRILKSFDWGADRDLPSQQLQNPTANYLTSADRAIIRLLHGTGWGTDLRLSEDPEIADLAMRRMLATGRCRWQSLASPALSLGPGRRGSIGWRVAGDGRQTIAVELDDDAAVVLPSASPWYVVPSKHLAGPIELELARPLVRVALAAPPVTAVEAAAINTALDRDLPELALPRPGTDIFEEIRSDPPVPALRLVSRERGWSYWGPTPKEWDQKIDLALLGFSYGGTLIHPNDACKEVRSFEERRIVVRSRNRKAERTACKRLETLGCMRSARMRSGRAMPGG